MKQAINAQEIERIDVVFGPLTFLTMEEDPRPEVTHRNCREILFFIVCKDGSTDQFSFGSIPARYELRILGMKRSSFVGPKGSRIGGRRWKDLFPPRVMLHANAQTKKLTLCSEDAPTPDVDQRMYYIINMMTHMSDPIEDVVTSLSYPSSPLSPLYPVTPLYMV